MSKRNSNKDTPPANNQTNDDQWVYLTPKELQLRQMYINEMIKNTKKALGIQVLIVLFGLPNSGKHTFFKQLQIIFGDLSAIVKTEEKLVVELTLNLLKLLAVKAIEQITFSNNANREFVNLVHASTLSDLKNMIQVDDQFGSKVHSLWSDKQIGLLYDSSPTIFPSHMQYFLSHSKRILSRNFQTGLQDWLFFPEDKSTPVFEYELDTEGIVFKMVLINQQTDRRKWLHLCDQANVVLHFLDLSSFDRQSTITVPGSGETKVVSQFEQAMDDFEEIINYPHFARATNILFLTKRDVLEEMVLRAGKDASKLYPDCNAAGNVSAIMQYFKDKIVARNRNNRALYTHYMTTTDTKNVQMIFSHCKEMIFKSTTENSSFDYFTNHMSEQTQTNVRLPKNVKVFRKKVRVSALPEKADITHDGLLHEYTFDTDIDSRGKSDNLFFAKWSTAVCKNPFSRETEYLLTVGLNSTLKPSEFWRKNLNLVVVLDQAGSMGAPFDKDATQSKMAVLVDYLSNLLDMLKEGDSLGIFTFDEKVETLCEVSPLSKINLSSLKGKLRSLKTRGGTDMVSALTKARKHLVGFLSESKNKDFRGADYENRIMLLTDCVPTAGKKTDNIIPIGQEMANDKTQIFTTYIAIGVPFSQQSVEAINKIPGANYFSVNSPRDCKRVLNDEFEFMVTPLAFDLKLTINTSNFKIQKVVGRNASIAQSEILNFDTLFPAYRKDEKLIVIKLKPLNPAATSVAPSDITLTTSYKTRAGKEECDKQQVDFTSPYKDSQFYFDNPQVRKAVLLWQYVDILHAWIDNSSPLTAIVTEDWKDKFRTFAAYFESEARQLKDRHLDNELQILNQLINYQYKPPRRNTFTQVPNTVNYRKFWCLCRECEGQDANQL